MQVQLGCYACVVKRAIRLAGLITDDLETKKKHIDAMLKTFLGMRDGCSTPEISCEFNQYFGRQTGVYDFFAEAKKRSTEIGLAVLPKLQKVVEASSDPFVTALLLAVSGNLIDYGNDPNFVLENIEERILAVLKEPYDHAAAKRLEAEMQAAERIVYVLDNCGEAVVDRLMIERFPGKITVAVRGKPIFNDAMRQDAIDSGITAPLIETGAGVPGVSRKYCSKEFLDTLDAADLIIAKGQGNFESIEECGFKHVFFLLRVKCQMVADSLKAPINSLQIIERRA